MKGQMEDVKKGKEIPHIRRLLDESRLISQVYVAASVPWCGGQPQKTLVIIEARGLLPPFSCHSIHFRTHQNVFNKRCLSWWPEINGCLLQMIIPASDWGRKRELTLKMATMKASGTKTTWTPTLSMDFVNHALISPLKDQFKALLLLFGKWFGNKTLKSLLWSLTSLKTERYEKFSKTPKLPYILGFQIW